MKLKFQKLPAGQRVYQTLIVSKKILVDFETTIEMTLRRSRGEADTDREEESTNSAGQSETNTLSFPDSCRRGRGNFKLEATNTCGLQHLS